MLIPVPVDPPILGPVVCIPQSSAGIACPISFLVWNCDGMVYDSIWLKTGFQPLFYVIWYQTGYEHPTFISEFLTGRRFTPAEVLCNVSLRSITFRSQPTNESK